MRGDCAARGGAAHPFEDKAFVRGVLINDDETVFGFGNDIRSGDLATRDAHGVLDGFGGCFVSRFGAGHWRCRKSRATIKD